MNKTIISIAILVMSIILISGCSSQNIAGNSVTQDNAGNMQGNHNTITSSNDATPYDSVQAKILGVNPYSGDTDGDGIPDKQDSTPNNADNTISSSGIDGFSITSAVVENNIDPVTNMAVSDHLEITLHNNIGKDINNIKVYYSILDRITGQTEAYIIPLSGLILKTGSTTTIHFDAQKSANEKFPQYHYPANPNSMYYLRQDPLDFTIIVAADGYNAQTFKVSKAAGGAEKTD